MKILQNQQPLFHKKIIDEDDSEKRAEHGANEEEEMFIVEKSRKDKGSGRS